MARCLAAIGTGGDSVRKRYEDSKNDALASIVELTRGFLARTIGRENLRPGIVHPTVFSWISDLVFEIRRSVCDRFATSELDRLWIFQTRRQAVFTGSPRLKICCGRFRGMPRTGNCSTFAKPSGQSSDPTDPS